MPEPTQREVSAAIVNVSPSNKPEEHLMGIINELFDQGEASRVIEELNLAQAGMQSARSIDSLLQNTPLGKKILSAIAIQEVQEEALIERQEMANIRRAQAAERLKLAIILEVAAELSAKKAEAREANANIENDQIAASKKAHELTEQGAVAPEAQLEKNIPEVNDFFDYSDYQQTKNDLIETTQYQKYLGEREKAIVNLDAAINSKMESHKTLIDSAKNVLNNKSATPEALQRQRIELHKARNEIHQQMLDVHEGKVDISPEEFAALKIQEKALVTLATSLIHDEEIKSISKKIEGIKVSNKPKDISKTTKLIEELKSAGYISSKDAERYTSLLAEENPEFLKQNIEAIKHDLTETFKKPELVDAEGNEVGFDEAYFVKPDSYEAKKADGNMYFLEEGDAFLKDEAGEDFINENSSPVIIDAATKTQLEHNKQKVVVHDGQAYLIKADQKVSELSKEEQLASAKAAENYIEKGQHNAYKARQIAEQHVLPGKSLEVAKQSLKQAQQHCEKKSAHLQTKLAEHQKKLVQMHAKQVNIANAMQGAKVGVQIERDARSALSSNPAQTPVPRPEKVKTLSVEDRLSSIVQTIKRPQPLKKSQKIQLLLMHDGIASKKSHELIAKEIAELEASGNLAPSLYNHPLSEVWDNHLGDSFEANLNNQKIEDENERKQLLEEMDVRADALDNTCAAKMAVEVLNKVRPKPENEKPEELDNVAKSDNLPPAFAVPKVPGVNTD